VMQHRALATGTIDVPQSSINTIDPANTPLILVAQNRVIEASRIASQHVLQILSVAPLDLTYHPLVDVKGIAKAPTHVSQVSSSNPTHATRSGVYDGTTSVQKHLDLRQGHQRRQFCRRTKGGTQNGDDADGRPIEVRQHHRL